MTIQIETSRLILRGFETTDAADLLDYLSAPSVNCFADDKISTLEQAVEKIIARQHSQDYIAISLKPDQQLIGELFFMKEQPDTYSVGWNFNPRFHGKGYAYESVCALFNHLFYELDCRRIYAYVEEDNIASQKLCERLGMRKEGCFIEYISFVSKDNGERKYENTLQYAILQKEWFALQAEIN